MQDQAIKEMKTIDTATKKKPHRRKKSPVILAEDEAIDKMIYYDKSSCMHAPKACHVPKF